MGASTRDERERSRFSKTTTKEIIMKNWKLVTVTAAAFSALVFAAACTVEEGDGTGDAGAAGSAGSSATAGAAGTAAAGAAGAAGAAAGAAGAAATSTFAEFWTPDAGGAKTACTTCLEAKCAAENTACGDVFGTGACAAGATCLTDQLAPATGEPASVDCAFVSCAGGNPTEAFNDVATCFASKCGTECGATDMFNGCGK